MIQYERIRRQAVTDGMRKHIPLIVPFLPEDECPDYDNRFGHELGHCIELVDRNQAWRLGIENFGWPLGEVGDFTPSILKFEIRVFAIQFLLEEMFTGTIYEEKDGKYNGILLDIDSSSRFLEMERFWKDKEQCKLWKNEKRAKDRIRQSMDEFKPKIEGLLRITEDYIVNHANAFNSKA